jgi:mRNA interferase MazF
LIAGDVVLVDWRDALPGAGEPNKRRPAIIVGCARFFGTGLPYEIVVPLTGEEALAITGASTMIEPTAQNGCVKTSYALAWNVQAVPHARLMQTRSRITADQLATIRAQIAECVEAVEN